MSSFLTQSQVKSVFGTFTYKELPKGMIEITDSQWIDKNIVKFAPPFDLKDYNGKLVKEIQCHRLIQLSLFGILRDVATQGLIDVLGPWAGVWVSRHIGRDISEPLSLHSWGVAFDADTIEFPWGSHKKRDPRLITIFHNHGFLSGMEYIHACPDPAHAEAGSYFLKFAGT